MKLQSAATVLPVAWRMAAFAIRPEPAVVVVRVTIYACDSHIAEHRTFVADDALRHSMRSRQNKSGGVMIEQQRVAHL
jgi:hypothetical protein